MCVAWFTTIWTWHGDAFRSWQTVAGGVVAISGGLVMTYLVSDRSTWFNRTPLKASGAEMPVPAAA